MSASTADLPVLPPKKAKSKPLPQTEIVMWNPKEPSETPDQECIVVTFGTSGVGKTSLLCRFGKRTFDAKTKSTTGVDFIPLKLMLHEKKTAVTMWDTAGQERYNAITNAYMERANLVILAFDVTKPATLLELTKIREEVQERKPTAICALFGLKADLGLGSWLKLAETSERIKELNCLAGVYMVSNKDQGQVDTAMLSALGVYFAVTRARKLRASAKLAAHLKAEQEQRVKLEVDEEAKSSCC
jgi:small GTP-binding protein